jgi:quercetin dioxygenase-like cupin family protein
MLVLTRCKTRRKLRFGKQPGVEVMHGNRRETCLRVSLAAVLTLWQGCASAAATPPAGTPPAASTALVGQLMEKELAGLPGKEVLMLTVKYLPGGASLPHRHDAQVFVYVLDGELSMQVAGGPLLTLRRGQTFYESPTDVHVVSANASKTAPAAILVFIIKDKNAPVSRAVAQEPTP